MSAESSPSPSELPIRTAPAPLDSRVVAPGSKSVTNRALLVAVLATGRSTLRNALESDDTRALRGALAALGFEVAPGEEAASLEIRGEGGRIPEASATLHVENAGTAMRFLASALCLGPGDYVLDGNARMRERPIGDLVQALRSLGASIDHLGRDGCPPLRIRGPGFRRREVSLRGHVSSQFVSSLLLAAPATRESLVVSVEGGELASPSYVALTMSVMRAFGALVEENAKGRFAVAAGSGYAGRVYEIEGDYSAASYFFAAPAIAAGRITVSGLDAASPQGDAAFPSLLERMGCRVSRARGAVTVERDADRRLEAIDADLHDMPDVAMTLAAVAAFARGTTRVRGVPNLRVKESDRIAAICTELRRIGVRAEERPDGFEVTGGTPHGAAIETYRDHRIAMSFALVGLRTEGVVIRDPGCVAKTFPDYFERLDSLSGGRR